MFESWLVVTLIMGALIFLDLLILGATYVIKLYSKRKYRKRERLGVLISRSLVSGELEGLESIEEGERLDYFIAWHRAEQSVQIPESLSKGLTLLKYNWNILPRVDKLLKSPFLRKRAIGVDLLFMLDKDVGTELLKKALEKESSSLLKLKIVQMLSETKGTEAVDIICRSMKGAGENYNLRVLGMLRDNHELLLEWSDVNRDRKEPEALRILIQATRTKLRDWYRPFLLEMITGAGEIAAGEAADVLMESYGDREALLFIMKSSLPEQRGKAVYHYFRSSRHPDEKETAGLFADDEFHSPVVAGLTDLISREPRLLPELFRRYKEAQGEGERKGYAAVLASRIRYFILRLGGEEDEEIGRLLGDVIELGVSSPLINFLNANKNLTREKILLERLRPYLASNASFLRQCQSFLRKDLISHLNLPPPPEIRGNPKIQLGAGDRFIMVGLIAFVLALPVAVFLLLKGPLLGFMTGEEIVVSYIMTYHRIFVFYTISINTVYLLLMLLSWQVIRDQYREWSTADSRFLNTRGLMPSISILAPAYNEEATIVQNVYSLLSLNYPNLEVIVINDGSGDRTIGRLIEQFDLKLVDYPLSRRLRTAPVQGLYKNDRIPNLLVIDKVNGGKADALNVGLNAARGEYICSIDADSLLEPEALTKLMFRILNSETKTVAIGGNIIPVNGCVTKNGSIREIHLPENRYSRYQTIEYLRSFITGRLGWTKLNGLMIISGAFGAFLRKDVLDIGGYMTGTGSLKRDTVGEDMELVVRLIRHLNEKGEKFRIDYSHNANCWTEVPEKMGDLLKQRDRWHRGLIEILIYHRKMLFNRKFGAPGLLTFPYLFIFELLGPFWEFMGYVVLLSSLVLGLIHGQFFLFMFTVVVLLGILVSSVSLLLAERDILYFKGKEFRQSMFTAIEENFGYRQVISMHRVYAFVAYLFRNKGWQKLKRKGFTLEEEGGAGEA